MGSRREYSLRYDSPARDRACPSKCLNRCFSTRRRHKSPFAGGRKLTTKQVTSQEARRQHNEVNWLWLCALTNAFAARTVDGRSNCRHAQTHMRGPAVAPSLLQPGRRQWWGGRWEETPDLLLGCEAQSAPRGPTDQTGRPLTETRSFDRLTCPAGPRISQARPRVAIRHSRGMFGQASRQTWHLLLSEQGAPPREPCPVSA